MNDEILIPLVEIRLNQPENFNKIVETLTRIGVPSYKERKLYQSCHIFHKRGKYYLVHFKELFLLDGKVSELSDEDIQRRNFIAKVLVDWGLVTIVNVNEIEKLGLGDSVNRTKIIKYSEKDSWNLKSKHSLGSRKRHDKNYVEGIA